MAEEFVTVARYSLAMEAEFAAGQLEEAGVRTILSGDLAATALTLPQVELQVPADQVELANRILGTLERRRAEAGQEWEDEAERDEGVWVCSLCGSPVEQEYSTCPDCQTPREAVLAKTSDLTDRPRRPPEPPPAPEGIRRLGELTATRPPAEVPPAVGEEDEVPVMGDVLVDDLARRTLRAAVISCLIPALLIYSLWLQLRLCLFPQPLSTRASWSLLGAFVLNILALMIWLILLSVWGPFLY